MGALIKNTPPVAVVLASLLLWVSFAWGLPAEAPAAEGEADAPVTEVYAAATAAEDNWTCGDCDTENVASANYCTECGAKKAGEAEAVAEDPWAGVKISDAYDYAKCLQCGKKNDVRAESCSRCGNELPQPSAEVTDPDMVFVPGKGYYREGTLLEPAKSRTGLWVKGLILTVSGSSLLFISPYFWPLVGLLAVPGVIALVYGLTSRTKPVYAFESGERFGPYESEAFARRSRDSEGEGLKIEVTLLGF